MQHESFRHKDIGNVYKDDEYDVEYDIAYMCLVMERPRGEVINLTAKERQAWIDAFNKITKERNKQQRK